MGFGIKDTGHGDSDRGDSNSPQDGEGHSGDGTLNHCLWWTSGVAAEKGGRDGGDGLACLRLQRPHTGTKATSIWGCVTPGCLD